jgi:hypothetical protein
MLEYFANQASGLIGLGAQPGPRLIAVVSHGDEQAELPLLWQLCMALVNFGYTLTVLDATGTESDTNPGLIHMLDDSRWDGDEHRQAGAWTVLPASRGIQKLCTKQQPDTLALQHLGQLFPVGSVVILYCQVEWLIPLLGDSTIEPLLAVSPARNSLLTGYLALKRLLITGKLKPTIVNMISELSSSSHMPTQAVAASLSECARRFLGQEISALDLAEQHGDEALQGETQRLALRLLESAMPLNASKLPRVAATHVAHFGQIDHFAGSH